MKYVFPQLEYIYEEKVFRLNSFYEVFITPSLNTQRYLIDDSIKYNNNIFNLLLNDDYSMSDYVYTFAVSKSNMNTELKYIINGTNYNIMYSIENGVNIFDISSDDIIMLDVLLNYRNGIIPDMSLYDINSFQNKISKLIIIYLNGVISKRLPVEYTDVLSTENDNILIILFEDYVIKKIYSEIKDSI